MPAASTAHADLAVQKFVVFITENRFEVRFRAASFNHVGKCVVSDIQV